MEPINRSNSPLISDSPNTVDDETTSETLLTLFLSLPDKDFSFIHNLKDRVKHYSQKHYLKPESSELIKNICHSALLKTKDVQVRSTLNSIIEECESAKHAEVTFDNIGEFWEAAVQTKNYSLLKQCFAFVKKETDVDFDQKNNYTFDSSYKVLFFPDYFTKFDNFKRLYSKIEPFLSIEWQVAVMEGEISKIYELVGNKLAQAYLRVDLCSPSDLIFLLQHCPHLKQLNIFGLPLNDELVSILRGAKFTIEIRQKIEMQLSDLVKQKNSEALSKFLHLAIEGQPILMNSSIISFESLGEDYVQQNVDKCLIYFLKALEFTQKKCSYIEIPTIIIPRGLLNERTAKTLRECWMNNLTNPLFFNNYLVFLSNFKIVALPKETIEEKNLELKLATGLFFDDKELIKACCEFIDTQTGVGLFNLLSNDPTKLMWINPRKLKIDQLGIIFPKIAPFIGKDWGLYDSSNSNQVEIYRIVGSNIQAISFEVPLNPHEIEKILESCPNLQLIIIDNKFPLSSEHVEAMMKCPATIFLEKAGDDQIIFLILQKAIITNHRVIFNFPTPFHLLEESFIFKNFERCLELESEQFEPLNILGFNDIPAKKFSNVLLNENTVIRVLEESIKLPKYTNDLIKKCLEVLKEKYSRSNSNNSEIAEFKQIFGFLLNNYPVMRKEELDQFGNLFSQLRDISIILPNENLEKVVELLRVLILPFPANFINENNVISLIEIALNRKNPGQLPNHSLLDKCFDFIQNKYQVGLNLKDANLEIILHKENKLSDTRELLTKLTTIFNRFDIQIECPLPSDFLQYFTPIEDRINHFIIDQKLTNITGQDLFLIFSVCPTLTGLTLHNFDKFIEEESLSQLKLPVLETLECINCQGITELPNLDQVPIKKFGVVNTPLIRLPKLNPDTIETIQLSKLSLDECSSFLNLTPNTVFLLDNLKLSETAQQQMCSQMSKGGEFQCKNVEIEQAYIDEAFVRLKISDHDIVNDFYYFYIKFKRNDYFLKTLFQRLARTNFEKYQSIIFPDLMPDLIRCCPPSMKENVYMYPIRTDVNQEQQSISLQLITLKPLFEPYSVLDCFSFMHKISRIKINYDDFQAGIDASGLSRQFISQLFQGLVTSESEHIRFSREEGKYLPSEGHQLKQVDSFHMISVGKLMAFAADSAGQYLIGEIFPDGFYKALINLHEVELESEISEDRLFELYDKLIEKNDQKLLLGIRKYEKGEQITEEQREALDILGIETKGASLTDIKKEVLEYLIPIMKKNLSILCLIAQGIRNSLPIRIGDFQVERWEQLENIPIQNLIKSIQGVLTKSALKDLIEVSRQAASNESDLEEVSEKTLENWIFEWIDKHSLEEIKNVLRAITGAPTVANTVKFKLSSGREMVPHTCFNLVDVPRHVSKEMFLSRLDMWGSGIGIFEYTIS